MDSKNAERKQAMDDADNNAATGLTHDQQEMLVKFAASRAARYAVEAGVPEHPELAEQLREMDEAFAEHPNRNDPLVQENHELQRHVAILQAALRAALTGELTIPAAC